jgi:hypothetical protein
MFVKKDPSRERAQRPLETVGAVSAVYAFGDCRITSGWTLIRLRQRRGNKWSPLLVRRSFRLLFWVLLELLIHTSHLSAASQNNLGFDAAVDRDVRRTDALERSATAVERSVRIARHQLSVSRTQLLVIPIIAIFAGILIPSILNRGRKALERRHNAVHLADQFLSVGFYRDVIVPVLQVYAKWMFLEPEWERQRYHEAVILGFIGFSEKYEGKLRQGVDQARHSLIRFGDHFRPPDYRRLATGSQDTSPNGYVQTVLSEHDALTYWLEWWGNVATMIEQQLVNEKTVRALFADWYDYMSDLMIELRFAVAGVREKKAGPKESESKPRWIAKLDALDGVFFGKWSYSGWLEFDDRYQERAMAAKGKAEKTVLVILGMSASAKSSGPGHEEPPTAVGFLSKTQ